MLLISDKLTRIHNYRPDGGNILYAINYGYISLCHPFTFYTTIEVTSKRILHNVPKRRYPSPLSPPPHGPQEFPLLPLSPPPPPFPLWQRISDGKMLIHIGVLQLPRHAKTKLGRTI